MLQPGGRQRLSPHQTKSTHSPNPNPQQFHPAYVRRVQPTPLYALLSSSSISLLPKWLSTVMASPHHPPVSRRCPHMDSPPQASCGAPFGLRPHPCEGKRGTVFRTPEKIYSGSLALKEGVLASSWDIQGPSLPSPPPKTCTRVTISASSGSVGRADLLQRARGDRPSQSR